MRTREQRPRWRAGKSTNVPPAARPNGQTAQKAALLQVRHRRSSWRAGAKISTSNVPAPIKTRIGGIRFRQSFQSLQFPPPDLSETEGRKSVLSIGWPSPPERL